MVDWLFSFLEKRRKKAFQKYLGVFVELLAPKKDEVILDVGAGLGTIANIVAEFSDEIFALEPTENKVEYMKRKHAALKAFSATASQIPFPTSYFDKLYVSMAFHHFPDQGDALEEFRRVLKKGGTLLIYEANPVAGRGRRLHFFETKILRNKGVHFLSPQELKELLSDRGFSVTDQRNAERGYLIVAKNDKTADDSRGWIDTDNKTSGFSRRP